MGDNKFKIQGKYAKMGMSIFVSGVGILLCFYLLYNLESVLKFFGKINDILLPFYIGIIAAYLLCPVYNRTLRYVYKAYDGRFPTDLIRYKLARIGATIVSLTVLGCVCVGVVMLILPELINSIMGLVRDIPQMVEQVYTWIDRILAENPGMATYVHDYIEEAVSNIMGAIQSNAVPTAEVIIVGLSNSIIGTFSTIIDIFVALVICVYVLNSKEIFQAQAKKLILAFCSPKKAQEVFEFAEICNNTFGGFINGKIIDSAIIGVICFVGMSLLKLPLAVLISVIVGVTNVIPFFGPFIGAIPSGILLLVLDPISAVKFAIWILVLQQLDGNIIGPKILGKATKLASFWVMFAILMGGGLFGFVGMILGVPTMAVIYVYFSRLVNKKLAAKQLTSDTMIYENFDKYNIDKEAVFGKERINFPNGNQTGDTENQ